MIKITTFAGWQLVVQYSTAGAGSWKTLDGIQRITYQLVEGIEAKDECGSRYPTLIEGNYGLTGTIERFYTGSGVWAIFATGEAGVNYHDIRINPNGTGGGQPYIQLGGIKFNTTSPTHRPGANLMIETWAFLGTGSVTTGTN